MIINTNHPFRHRKKPENVQQNIGLILLVKKYLYTQTDTLKLWATALLILTGTATYAQDDTACDKGSLTVSAFAEVYYGYDLNKPENNTRPPFVYSHNRHNEINVNLAYLKANYDAGRVRANLALGTGTYMHANYAAEPDVIKNIYEANVGIKIFECHNLWVDAGVMPSHLGFESAYTPSCLTLTRAIMSDNNPYYESGVKLGYTSHNNKWYLAALALNGWQRIYRPDGNTTISGGTQVTFTPSSRVSINYSTFFGNNSPDSVRRMRVFNDVYATVQIAKRLQLLASIDYGTEQQHKGSDKWYKWGGGAAILSYKMGDKTALAARAEYYRDKHAVIVQPVTAAPFKTAGYSVNFDYRIMNNVLWRTEAKLMRSGNRVFLKDGEAVRADWVFTTSLCVSFERHH